MPLPLLHILFSYRRGLLVAMATLLLCVITLWATFNKAPPPSQPRRASVTIPYGGEFPVTP